MSTETTIRIVDVFSVSKKTEKNGNRESERLSEAKPEVSDFDEDVLVSICMKIETYGSNSKAISDVVPNGSIVDTDSAEPSSSSNLPNEPNNVMSQALDLSLRIHRTDNDSDQEVPKCDLSNTEVQYKFIRVKEHVRKMKIGANRKSVDRSLKTRLMKCDSTA